MLTIYSRDIMCSTSVLGLISMMIFILFLLTNGAVSVLDYGAALTWSKPTLSQPDVLYGEDGDGDSDHSCWERPEDMTTPRTTFKIDDQTLVLILQLRLLLPWLLHLLLSNLITLHIYATELINHAKQGRYLLQWINYSCHNYISYN